MNGNTLPDEMDLLDLVLRITRPIYVIVDGRPSRTTTTEFDSTRWMRFDRYKWILYILSQMPEHYLRQNLEEGVHITFQTDRPDGLIWFTGNLRDNMYLALRVRNAPQLLLNISLETNLYYLRNSQL